jgi:hypothetical protein
MQVHFGLNMKRDDFFRCKICHQLFADSECYIDLDKGIQCPNGCEEAYEQPDYESPLISEDASTPH